MPYTLRKSERLCGTTAIAGLFRNGKSGFSHPVKYVFEPYAGSGVAVMVSVPKRNHKRANKRNLLKRRMREAFRTNRGPLCDLCREKGLGLRVALIYGAKEIADFNTIEYAVRNAIAKIADNI